MNQDPSELEEQMEWAIAQDAIDTSMDYDEWRDNNA